MWHHYDAPLQEPMWRQQSIVSSSKLKIELGRDARQEASNTSLWCLHAREIASQTRNRPRSRQTSLSRSHSALRGHLQGPLLAGLPQQCSQSQHHFNCCGVQGHSGMVRSSALFWRLSSVGHTIMAFCGTAASRFWRLSCVSPYSHGLLRFLGTDLALEIRWPNGYGPFADLVHV